MSVHRCVYIDVYMYVVGWESSMSGINSGWNKLVVVLSYSSSVNCFNCSFLETMCSGWVGLGWVWGWLVDGVGDINQPLCCASVN